MTSFVTQISYWPDGSDPHDPEDYNLHDFRVNVEWMGPRTKEERAVGGWRVSARHGNVELSRAGNWKFLVSKYQKWQHRFETLEEACAMAEKYKDSVVINGGTYAQWKQHWAEKAAAKA